MFAVSVFKTNIVYLIGAWPAVFLQAYIVALLLKERKNLNRSR
jgi:hypothetical protein